MKRRLGSAGAPPDLLLEDVSLKFADRPKASIASLEERAMHFPGLAYPLAPPAGSRRVQRLRWLVTSGQVARGAAEDDGDARTLREHERAHGGDGGVIFKPVAGIYDLCRQARLRLSGFAPPALHDAPRSHGHGAPGKVALVARTLVARARALREARPALEGQLLAAVCALDALELSGGESPMLGFEALSLRHECEVLAECSFGGLQHRIEVQERFADIRDALQTLAVKVVGPSRRLAQLNAEVSILTALMRVFRDHARFDEEFACLNRIRDVNFLLGLQRRPTLVEPMTWLAPLRWAAHGYFNLLIRSPQHFIGAILAWLTVLAMALYLTGYDGASITGSAVICALLDAVSTFIGMGGPVHPESCTFQPGPGTTYFAVVGSAIVLGAVHLGIFVSFVYTLLARR